MSKQQRHEMKKVERARYRRGISRRSGVKAGAAALSAAAAIAAGTQAYAAPVRFDNPPGPGHFDWVPTPTSAIVSVDIGQPASNQSGLAGAMAFRQELFPDGSTVFEDRDPAQNGAVELGGYGDYFSISHPAGTLIPSGAPWGGGGAFIFYSGFPILIPEGVQTYLGTRFNPGDGLHYGWIGVVRTNTTLDAFAWGYESEVGLPIAAGAPEPGTLALLAFGAAGSIARRRRSRA